MSGRISVHSIIGPFVSFRLPLTRAPRLSRLALGCARAQMGAHSTDQGTDRFAHPLRNLTLNFLILSYQSGDTGNSHRREEPTEHDLNPAKRAQRTR
jgi:hypothetical protein